MSSTVELLPRTLGAPIALADGSQLDLRLLDAEQGAAVLRFIDAASAKLTEIGGALGLEFDIGRLAYGGYFGVKNPELDANLYSPWELHVAFLPPRSLNTEGDILEGSTVVINQGPGSMRKDTTSIPHVNEITFNPEQRQVEFRGEGPHGETFEASIQSTEEGDFTISTRTVYSTEKYIKVISEEIDLPPSRAGPR